MSASPARRSSSPRTPSDATEQPTTTTTAPDRQNGRREEERELLYGETVETMRAIVAAQGLSQRELARRVGVSDARMSRILTGRENLTLRTLADVGWALGLRFEAVAVPLPDRSATPAHADPAPPRWLAGHASLVARRVRAALKPSR